MGVDSSPNPAKIPISDQPNPTTSLLAFNTDFRPPAKSTSVTTTVLITSLLLLTSVAVATASIFAFLYFSARPSHSAAISTSRSLTKLPHPIVILISSDGFRFGYQFKAPTPNIHRLITSGTEAELGLIPIFPNLTFPNHYSIVTGLYPSHHGIINNYFFDPKTNDSFSMASHEPKWWLGELITLI